MYLAKIESGSVTQVIVCDSLEWAETNVGGVWVAATGADGGPLAGVGYGWDGSVFTPPPPQTEIEDTDED